MPRSADMTGGDMSDLMDATHRIKRNTACVQCRDAKVRCNASLSQGQPCLRCAKLDLACVIDKSHKRTTRRSKLEELAQEVRTIKEAVAPRNRHDGRRDFPMVPLPPECPPKRPVTTILSTASSPSKARQSFSAEGEGQTSLTPMTNNTTVTGGAASRPSQPRALASRVFSGEDIDYYFDKYFECFHPYFPVVRVRDPDAVYASGPLLFWVIMFVACRRYARDSDVFPFLVDSISSEIWTEIAHPPLRLPCINALLLMAAWPLPNIRFMSDPSSIYTGMAMNACFMIGLHTGHGHHPEFKTPQHNVGSSDEEATYTWAGCNVISNRVASYSGCPSMSLAHSKVIDQLLDGTCPFPVPHYFAVHLAVTRFSNRLSRTMAAALEESHGVSHHVVSQWEEEYMTIQRLIYPENADLDHFTLLVGLLEIQIYYFMPLPGFSIDVLKRNAIRCYNTARSLVVQALQLDRDTGFLAHAPHFVFRALVAAQCVVLNVLMSAWCADVMAAHDGSSSSSGSGGGEDALVEDMQRAMRRCSVQDGDLPVRLDKMMDLFWSVHRECAPGTLFESDHPVGLSLFSHRLGASMAFDCVRRWKQYIERVRPELLAAVPGISHGHGQEAGVAAVAGRGQNGDVAGTNGGEVPVADPSQQVYWDAFMDDFDWSFATNLFDMPQA